MKNVLKFLGLVALVVSPAVLAAKVTFNIDNQTGKTVGYSSWPGGEGSCVNEPNRIVCTTDASGGLVKSGTIYVDGFWGAGLNVSDEAIYSGQNFSFSGQQSDYAFSLSNTRWNGKTDLTVTLTVKNAAKK